MRVDRKSMFSLLLGLGFLFMAGTAEADSMCDLYEGGFYDFPGSMWTFMVGDWIVNEDQHGVQASHDPLAGDHGAAIVTPVGEGFPDLLLYTWASFIDEVTGEIVLLINVGPDLTGYAFSLDGDNNLLKLWRAKIHEDGSLTNLETLSVVEDVVFEADHHYILTFTYSDDLDLTGTINSGFEVHAPVTDMPDGGVALAYTGSEAAHFELLCIGTTSGYCFIERALFGPSPFLDPRTIRRLLPFLVLLGFIGTIHEFRTRKRGNA